MRSIFIDSSFYLALLVPRDNLRLKARAVLEELTGGHVRFVTSEAIFAEVLTRLSGFGPHWKEAGIAFVENAPSDSRLTIVPMSSDLFQAGLSIYRARLDKSFSVTDCMSMAICHDRGISEVLTADHDFEQEGFTILLP